MIEALPPLPTLELLRERLPLIFPEGISNRNYFVREIAVRTVFVMFYVGAIESAGVYLRPDQVCRMTNDQSGHTSDNARTEWRVLSVSRKFVDTSDRWYASNTRESIRDE